jgi:hypothetical protein
MGLTLLLSTVSVAGGSGRAVAVPATSLAAMKLVVTSFVTVLFEARASDR